MSQRHSRPSRDTEDALNRVSRGRSGGASAPPPQGTIPRELAAIAGGAPVPSLNKPRETRAGLRLRDFDYTGVYAYHLVTVTHRRKPYLKEVTAQLTMNALHAAAAACSFELLAFTVLPDHVHILAVGTAEQSNAVRLMQRFKQASGYAHSRDRGVRLWASRFYDRALRRQEDVLPVARYIFDNPVAAGLVSDAGDWPFTGGSLFAPSSFVGPAEDEGAKAPSPRPPDGRVGQGKQVRA